MCTQYVMADKLRRARIGYLTVFHDLTNSFASSDQEELAQSMAALVSEEDVGLFHHRLYNAVCTAPCRDDEHVFMPRSGAPPSTN